MILKENCYFILEITSGGFGNSIKWEWASRITSPESYFDSAESNTSISVSDSRNRNYPLAEYIQQVVAVSFAVSLPTGQWLLTVP